MASCPTLRCEGRFSLLVLFMFSRVQGRSRWHSHHATSLPADTVSSETPRSVSVVCASPTHTCRRPWGPSHVSASHAAGYLFARSGSAMLCASMAHTTEPDCGMWVHLLQKVVRPSPPDRPPLGRWPRRSVRCPSPPLSLCRKKVARTSASRLSEGFPQCQIMPQAALSFGQPRSISQLGRAGLPYRPCFRRGAVQRGRG